MEFVDPPAPPRRDTSERWQKVVEELKQNPQQWGKVGNFSVGVAQHIRKGRYPAFIGEGVDNYPEEREAYVQEHWEVTTRKTPDGRNDLYVRWLG